MLESIRTKCDTGTPITNEEALYLFTEVSEDTLYQLADSVKRQKHHDSVYWVNNRQINYTNICIKSCSFCAFSKIRKGDEGAYEWTLDEICEKAREAVERGAQELHIVGGLHPDHDYSFYPTMIGTLKKLFPEVILKAFTAIEILHFSTISGKAVEAVLTELQECGLQSLTGGGAEILEPEMRNKICKGKESTDEWIAVHKAAHKLGLFSNATMLFGHIESFSDRVVHMEYIRNLQSETAGFFAFIPLVFHPDNTRLGKKVSQMTSEEDILKTIAVARIYLHNVPHIKAYWMQVGIDTARKSLHCGASDLDGTIMEEKITNAAGARCGTGMTVSKLENMIKDEGLSPVERNGMYEVQN
ncbi:MAG: aminofutalosine synthase MqnE [Fibrobacterales bacterium]